jgi:Ca2+-binding EF-hand superfamily protein
LLDRGSRLRRAFERVDKNRDGLLGKEEVLKSMLAAQLKVPAADLEEMMQTADKNGDGYVSNHMPN